MSAPRALGPSAALVLAAALLAACPGDPPVTPPADAGPPEVVIGTGFVDPDTGLGWMDLVDGADAGLVRGPQGGQHVWIDIRQRGMNPARMTIHMRLYVLTDPAGAELPEPVEGGRADLRLSFQPRNDAGGYFEISNLTLFVPEPDDVLGRRGRIEVQLVDQDGLVATATVEVQVDWAPGEPRSFRADGGSEPDAGTADADASS